MTTAIVHPNIALVKYWGKRDKALNLPSTGSISLTVDRYETRTTVSFGSDHDVAYLSGRRLQGKEHERVFRHLDLVVPGRPPAEVVSANNFPSAAGLASSSSAFAALTMAAAASAGLSLPIERLSELARRGSGSACRSLWGGFVEWRRGVLADGSDSHGYPLAPQSAWDLRLVVAVLDPGQKKIGSREAMNRTTETSPMYPVWVNTADLDLDEAREAIAARDLSALGAVMERSALKMHATMMTALPAIRYWQPASVAAMEVVESLRAGGVSAFWTMDAGPNVKVLCEAHSADAVARALAEVAPAVEVLGVGGPPRLIP